MITIAVLGESDVMAGLDAQQGKELHDDAFIRASPVDQCRGGDHEIHRFVALHAGFLVPFRGAVPAERHAGHVGGNRQFGPAVAGLALQGGRTVAQRAGAWLAHNGVGDVDGGAGKNLSIHFVLRAGPRSLEDQTFRRLREKKHGKTRHGVEHESKTFSQKISLPIKNPSQLNFSLLIFKNKSHPFPFVPHSYFIFLGKIFFLIKKKFWNKTFKKIDKLFLKKIF